MEKELSSVSPSTIGTRISEICADVGGKKKLANMTGISEAQMYRYIGDSSQPTVEPLINLAKAAGVNILWLATGEGPKYPGQTEPTQPPQPISNDAQFLSEFALIPGYDIQVSAGFGREGCDDTEPTRHLAFRRRWLEWRGFKEADLVIVWAEGDSMEPVINHKNTLLINTARKQLTDGNIFVLRNDNQLWVKRVQVRPGAWVLLSDNPSYPPFEVPIIDQHNFEVVGQVVHISKDIG